MGYESAKDMVERFLESEKQQLDGFVRFIRWKKLAYVLSERDWAVFARKYNGPSYRRNGYDGMMARAYQYFLKNPEHLP